MTDQTAPTSVDDLVASLDAADNPAPEDSETEEAEDDQPAEPLPADDASEASDEEEPGDSEDEETTETAAAEPVDAPQWWDAEAKAKFAALTPELQAVVRLQEDKREAIVTKAKADAADVRQAANRELEQLSAVSKTVAEWLPKAYADFNAYYGENGFDLKANVAAHGAEQAIIMQAEYQEHQQALHRVAQAQREAEQHDLIAYQREQREKLATVCPDLADPKEGATRQKELASYLLQHGATQQDLERIPADLIALAYDGMKSRKNLAEAKSFKAPLKPIAPSAKPAAAQAAPSKTRAVQQARNRFSQTRSIDDLVNALNAESP